MSNEAKPGWGVTLYVQTCDQCGVSFARTNTPDKRQPCPNCLQGQLESVDEETTAEVMQYAPEAALPFQIEKRALAMGLDSFVRSVPFKPIDLNKERLMGRLQAVYMPVWWVDAEAKGQWSAEVGFDYNVVSHRDSYRGGWVSEQVEETRIRWEPRVGLLERRYDNILAPAIEDENHLKTRVGGFKLDAAQPYQAQELANKLIRLPQRPPEDAWSSTAPGFLRRGEEDCQRACGGQHIRQFKWTVEFGDKHWTLLLLPVLVTYYIGADRRRHWVMINGQTGQLSGERRAVTIRAGIISGGILAGALLLFFVSVISALLGIDILAGGLFMLAGLMALVAPIPFGRAWWFNRQQPRESGRLLS